MVNINIFPSTIEGTDRQKVNNVKFLKNIITVVIKLTSWTFPGQHSQQQYAMQILAESYSGLHYVL